MLYNETDLIKVCDLFEEKKQLSKERDLCAEFYNVMLSYANKNIDNPEKYKYYLDVVEQMEPYAKDTKERVREINRELCKFSGANDITGQTSSAAGTPDTSTQTVDNIVFSSGYNTGEIDADTDVLYQENRSPITRASDQTENIKLIVEF